MNRHLWAIPSHSRVNALEINGSGKQDKCVAQGRVSLQIRNALSLSLTISLFEFATDTGLRS